MRAPLRGARVDRGDASDGSTLRSEPPLEAGEGARSLLLPYLADGKLDVALEPGAEGFHDALDDLLQQTDVLIEDSWPGDLFAGPRRPEALVARHPGLVVISLSPFGRTGPY